MTGQEEARSLRARGMTYAAIGETLGVGQTTVFAWLNPKRVKPYRNGRAMNPARARANDRKYARENRKTCPSCGGLMGIGYKAEGVCVSCRREARDQRWRQVRDLWEGGASLNEIAAAIGKPRNALGPEMARMRHAGWELSYRRSGWTKRINA